MRSRFALVAALLTTGCAAAPVEPAAPVTVHAGDKGLVNLPAGRYAVSWRADCTSFSLEWAPTSGAPAVEIPAALPSGSVVVDLPAGPAYVNRGGSCAGAYDVTITPAASPS